MGVLHASTVATVNAVNSGATNPHAALLHFLKMLTYYLYAPLFRKHSALPANPSLALNKVKQKNKPASAGFVFHTENQDGF